MIKVIEISTIDNLQNMRTNLNNMQDTIYTSYLEKKYQDSLVKIVATKLDKSIEDVLSKSKPLTLQQIKDKVKKETIFVKEGEGKKESDNQDKKTSIYD